MRSLRALSPNGWPTPRICLRPGARVARRSPLHKDLLEHLAPRSHRSHAGFLDQRDPARRPRRVRLSSCGPPADERGVAVAVPTPVAGAADGAEMTDSERRVGVVHALGTDIAIFLFMGSLVARLRGRYAAATRLGLGANLGMTGAGFLSGHLALNQGTARRDQSSAAISERSDDRLRLPAFDDIITRRSRD